MFFWSSSSVHQQNISSVQKIKDHLQMVAVALITDPTPLCRDILFINVTIQQRGGTIWIQSFIMCTTQNKSRTSYWHRIHTDRMSDWNCFIPAPPPWGKPPLFAQRASRQKLKKPTQGALSTPPWPGLKQDSSSSSFNSLLWAPVQHFLAQAFQN